jgi:hypothetical protein
VVLATDYDGTLAQNGVGDARDPGRRRDDRDEELNMDDEDPELDRRQSAYKAAIDTWITAIRGEEQLASVHHTVAQVDTWEHAHFLVEHGRRKAEAAKVAYERALRLRFFDID